MRAASRLNASLFRQRLRRSGAIAGLFAITFKCP